MNTMSESLGGQSMKRFLILLALCSVVPYCITAMEDCKRKPKLHRTNAMSSVADSLENVPNDDAEAIEERSERCLPKARQNGQYRLRRTYTMYALVDELKIALIEDETEVIEECLGRCLPKALDRQYVLLGLQTSERAQDMLLKAIEDYWYTEISVHPTTSLSTLFQGLRVLATSYGLHELDYAFKWMLTRLKRRILHCPKVAQSRKLIEKAQKIPAYDTAPRLQSIVAHAVATKFVQEVFEEVLDELPEEWLALTDKAKPFIHVDLPFTRD